VKARAVKGLEPDMPLVEAARRIVHVRLDELFGFSPAILDPDAVRELHDMRIAAKRLRYVLEVTEPCFGAMATEALDEAKALQEVLGEIHDCDVMRPRVEAHARRLADHDAMTARLPFDGAPDLPPEAVKDVPNRHRYPGLRSLCIYFQARRSVLYESFLEHWARLERERFRERLEADLVADPVT
jgi:hypothetical protein